MSWCTEDVARDTTTPELISVVRHAEAGDRERFEGDDAMRPLSREGRRQSELIAKALSGSDSVLVSSPALRCVETLAPLSRRLRRAITVLETLAEGTEPEAALASLLGRSNGPGLVACSHGDVLTGLVDLALKQGAEILEPVDLRKGATASFVLVAGELVSVSFVPPPNR